MHGNLGERQKNSLKSKDHPSESIFDEISNSNLDLSVTRFRRFRPIKQHACVSQSQVALSQRQSLTCKFFSKGSNNENTEKRA